MLSLAHIGKWLQTCDWLYVHKFTGTEEQARLVLEHVSSSDDELAIDERLLTKFIYSLQQCFTLLLSMLTTAEIVVWGLTTPTPTSWRCSGRGRRGGGSLLKKRSKPEQSSVNIRWPRHGHHSHEGSGQPLKRSTSKMVKFATFWRHVIMKESGGVLMQHAASTNMEDTSIMHLGVW